MPEVIHLSHWDAAMPIVIPCSVVKDLANYQVLGIRFLYNCLQKGYRGAILNEEEGMNPHIQVCAFLNALNSSITIESPAIILCTSETFGSWHYHLSNYAGNAVTVLSQQNSDEILQGKSLEIILSTVENLKWLKGAELDFFTVVVDDLDVVVNKKFVKQIKGQYHIGITGKNFLKYPAQKLVRSMLLWANPGSVGKLEDFCQEDDDHLKHNRDAYSERWLRLTWSFCNSFKKPTDDELQCTEATINEWAHTNLLCNTTTITKKATRKRKCEVLNPQKLDTEKTSLPSNEFQDNDQVFRSSHEVSDTDVKVTLPSHEFGGNVQSLGNSQETIIYDYSDDCSLLMSIMNNDGEFKESKSEHIPSKKHTPIYEDATLVKSASTEDILLSIMNDDFHTESDSGKGVKDSSSSANDVLSMILSDSN